MGEYGVYMYMHRVAEIRRIVVLESGSGSGSGSGSVRSTGRLYV